MTATVTDYVPTKIPGMEVVVLTASDNETFKSRKYATIRAATVSLMEDTTAMTTNLSVAISTNTATIHATSMVDVKVCLVIYGLSGN